MNAEAILRTNITARCAALGLTVTEAEARAGLGNGTVSKFLRNADRGMGIEYAEKLAPVLQTTLGALLGADGAGRAALREIHPDQITRSPLNPRKATALDKGAISDLSRSIAEKGVLQPIIVRPISAARWQEINPAQPAPNLELELFEIGAGERRWRAAALAIETGLVAPDFAIPASVRAMDDDELVEIALVENIDRADMSALEEADGLAFLHDRARAEGKQKDFTRRLAEATGKSERWVQKRVRLAADLTADGRKRLSDGMITLQMAMELSELPAAAQAHALEKIVKGDAAYRTAEGLQAALVRELPKVDDALFDEGDYDGGFVEKDKIRYFADIKQANRLQDAAVKAKAATLRETRAFVEIVKGWISDHAYPEAAKSLKAKPGETKKPWGAVIVRDGFAVKLHDRRLMRAENPRAAETSGGALFDHAAEAKRREDRQHARAPHRIALQQRLAGVFAREPMTAIKCLLLPIVLGERHNIGAITALAWDQAARIRVLDMLDIELPAGLVRPTAETDAAGLTEGDDAEDGEEDQDGEEEQDFEDTEDGEAEDADADDDAPLAPDAEEAMKRAEAAQAELEAWAGAARERLRSASDRNVTAALAAAIDTGPLNKFHGGLPFSYIDWAIATLAGIDLPEGLTHEVEGGDILDLHPDVELPADEPPTGTTGAASDGAAP